jgi:uncharacterized protein (TIRG00374 family)
MLLSRIWTALQAGQRGRGMIQLAKLALGLSLLGVLVAYVDWSQISYYLLALSPLTLGTALFLLIVQFPISTLKWKQALEIHKLRYSFPFLQKVLCIGFFINNFLPTTIGGDGYRILRTIPKDGLKSRAVSAVLLERIVGFGVLLSLGFVGALFALVEDDSYVVDYYVGAGLVAGGTSIALLMAIRQGMFSRLASRLVKNEKMKILTTNIDYIRRDAQRLWKIILVSVLFQCIAILVIYILFASLGADGVLAKCALIAAMAGIVAVLPISINGIGVAEGSFVAVAYELGIDFDQAVVVALLLRFASLPLSAICGIVYLADTYPWRSTEGR